MDEVKREAILVNKIAEVGADSRVLRFIGSTESPDRSQDVIEVGGWDVNNYIKNPVFLWAHQYDRPPVGKARSVTIDKRTKSLVFDIYFPTIDELSSDKANPSDHALFVDTVYNMYKNGLLNATSVGFAGRKYAQRDDQEGPYRGLKFTEQELLELSAVPVPANPEALVVARSIKCFDPKGIAMVEDALTKAAIPFKHYDLADESAEWNGPKAIAESDVADLKIMSAWYDAENADVKNSYKLPHHMGKDDGYKTVWRGVASAMGALMGGRGGVDIPDADRKAVYSHLSRHYAEFDKTPPEYKEIDMDEVRMKALESENAELKAALIEMKAGARHSKATIEALKECGDHMKAALGIVDKMTSDGVEDTENDSSDGVEKPAHDDKNGKAITLDTPVDELNIEDITLG